MKTYNSKEINTIIDNLREELRAEQQIKQNELKKELTKEHQHKFRRFVVFMVVLCLIISGITGVASYTIAAGNVAYTPRDNTWTVENTSDAIDELRDTVGSALVGSIYSFMGTYAPFGYLACDGSEYNIADYPRLAEHINRHFGSTNYFGGNGTTTFKVPDLRGEFLRGSGTNSRTSQGSGAAVGTHQDGTLIPYSFVYQDGSVYYKRYSSGATNERVNADKANNGTNAWSSKIKVESIYQDSSAPVNYTTRPTNTSVLYIIKY